MKIIDDKIKRTLTDTVNPAKFALAAQIRTNDLAKNFVTPPASARPWVFWFWMNGNITSNGITADLEAMQRVGIGGVLLMDVNDDNPQGHVKYGGKEWYSMVKHAAQEASRLGLEIDIYNCGGYTSSGGPWTTVDHAMQTLVTSEKRVHGPMVFNDVLPSPPKNVDTYHDIAVLAFRSPKDEVMSAQEFAPKVTASVALGEDRKGGAGKLNTAVIFPPIKQGDFPHYIQFEFAKPYTARQLAMQPGMAGYIYNGHGTIEISDDGQAFRTVTAFSLSLGQEKQTINFAPVSARFYRVMFTDFSTWPNGLVLDSVDMTTNLGINNLTDKVFTNIADQALYDQAGVGNPADAATFSPDQVVGRTDVVELTSRLGADGKLRWDVPVGDWIILRVGYTPTGVVNHPAGKEGTGLECDKLSREAVEAHWTGLMDKVIREMGPLVGKSLNAVHIDSWEVGSQNWTPKFREEFQKRRGYDLLPFLTVLRGRVVDSPEVSERFLWDFRRTIGDMFAENYSGVIAELAHRNGLLFSIEPYPACPTDELKYGSYADIPMSEFWAGSSGGGNELAASIAHVYGRKIVGAEAFTATPEEGKWLTDPFSLKATGDQAWCSGVNRLIIHRYAHQPWTQPAHYPGMTMDWWGTHFERTITWWEQSRAWLHYLARSQYLLQQGLFVADVCVFVGDGVPNSFKRIELPVGYAYDGCNADALKLMSVKNGRLVLPSGMSYRMLVLPSAATMTVPTLRKIKQLADAGALIVGPRPTRAPGLTDYPKCDNEVKQLADATKITSDRSPSEALTTIGLKPDFEYSVKAGSKLAFIHRQTDEADIYFVSNQREQFDSVECTFRVAGKVPELWYPDTGRIESSPSLWRETGGRIVMPLQFDPAGSVFVVFRKRAVKVDPIVSISRDGATLYPMSKKTPKVIVRKATYGVTGRIRDVRVKVQVMVDSGRPTFGVAEMAVGDDPAPQVVKTLVVEYSVNGKVYVAQGADGATVSLDDKTMVDPARFVDVHTAPDGNWWLEARQAGRYDLKTASGRTLHGKIATPQPMLIAGPWQISFDPKWGGPARPVVFERLEDWSQRPEKGIRYYSGTATYVKEVELPAVLFEKGCSLSLDLGLVKNIAEVFLNGKPLGILWKPPFRAELAGAARPGKNRLEIKITNLWPNRLIGDEQLPPDCEWRASHWTGSTSSTGLKAWPKWLLENKPSPSGRLTFSTWHHWKKDDALLPSGLLGPVTVQAAVQVQVKP